MFDTKKSEKPADLDPFTLLEVSETLLTVVEKPEAIAAHSEEWRAGWKAAGEAIGLSGIMATLGLRPKDMGLTK